MFLLHSTKRFAVAGLLLVTGCRGHGHGKPNRDAAVDPSTGRDAAVSCSAAAADEGCGVVIHGEFNQCPRVSFDASPIQVSMTRAVTVSSMSVDPEGDALSYQWTAEPDGEFDDASGLLTQYHCQSMGRKTLQLTVLDARGCDSQGELEVTCVNVDEFMRSGTTQIATPP
jgi:hypothetical protein